MAVSGQDINPQTGKPYAINPNTNVWDDNYFAKNFGGGASSGGYSSGGGDLNSLIQAQTEAMKRANEPAVQTLQAQIPTIGQQFGQTKQYLEKQVTNLDDRYNNLLNSIKGMQTQETGRVEQNTSAELGRRGISAQSGMFGQTVNRSLEPVYQRYAGQLGEVGAQRQSSLDTLLNQIAGLPIQQTQQEQAIRSAIAQLQAGGNTSAISNALQMHQQQQQNELARREEERAATLQNAQLAYQQQMQPLEIALKQKELNKASEQSVNIMDQIKSMFGTGISEPKPSTKSTSGATLTYPTIDLAKALSSGGLR